MGVLSQVQRLLAREGRTTLSTLVHELEADPGAVERALIHLETTGRVRRMTVRGSDPGVDAGSEVACGKSCSCGGGPAGPEFTVWVALPLPR